jgi:hypothetical protein
MPRIKLRDFPADGKILERSSGPGSTNEAYVRNIHSDPYVIPATAEEPLGPPGPGVGGAVPGGASSLPVDPVVEIGLMSASNGSLGSANLGVDDFLVTSDHIMPEQAVLARMEGMRQSSVFYGNGIGQRADGVRSEAWVTVPGATLRWYQPYATTVSLMHWDMFFSFNNWRGVYADLANQLAENGRKTKIELRCLLDGEYISYSKRRLGENFFHPVSPGSIGSPDAIGPGTSAYGSGSSDPERDEEPHVRGGNPKYIFPEAHSAVPLSLHHAQALSKGFHEISMQVKLVQIPGEACYVQNIGDEKRTGLVKGRGYFELTAKISLGIRNARVISFL